jgi:hypothetical protein
MRNTDPEPEKFQPLGSPIKAPAPPPPVLKPQGPSGIVTVDGKMQTTNHKPHAQIEHWWDFPGMLP